MGDNTFAQASFQPDARHYIITPTRALNMGRVGNFIDFISNNANLTESQKEALTRVALGAATKEEIAEIKAKYQKKPYKDLEVTNEHIIREFDENIDPIELKWHRDREDRIVEIVGKTDWKVQLENKLPISLNESIFIPKGEWHRLIKGNGTLTLKIHKK
jgi:mannose-6-phosphate isomerase-like protein (cupin superfamily)